MIFRQLFDPASSTCIHFLGDPATGKALVVDTVLEGWQRDAALLRDVPVVTVCRSGARSAQAAYCCRRPASSGWRTSRRRRHVARGRRAPPGHVGIGLFYPRCSAPSTKVLIRLSRPPALSLPCT
jgi:hypothetical protein